MFNLPVNLGPIDLKFKNCTGAYRENWSGGVNLYRAVPLLYKIQIYYENMINIQIQLGM